MSAADDRAARLAALLRLLEALPSATVTVHAPGVNATVEIPSGPRPAGAARHSADFRSVHWFGADYSFTPLQAAVVRQLWDAWEHGTPDVGGQTLLENADSAGGRLDHVFRDHPAWGALIVSTAKGLYRLARPENSD